MTTTHAQLYDAFINYEAARGARPRYLKAMPVRVGRFLAWLESSGVESIDIDRRTARAYLTDLIEYRTPEGEPFAARTIISYRLAAAIWCRFLEETRRISANPFCTVSAPRAPKTVLEGVLKEAEMESLLKQLAQWETLGQCRLQARRYLAHVVAEVQYASGLRIAEVAALQREDIDLERNIIIVRGGKSGRDRIAYLSDYAVAVLAVYMDRMRPLILDSHNGHCTDKLFGCGYDRLSHSQNAQLADVAAPLGLAVTNHGFRHALGYHLLRSGCPLRQIQEILGHQNIKDTEVYTKVDVSSIQAVLDELHPRGKQLLGTSGASVRPRRRGLHAH